MEENIYSMQKCFLSSAHVKKITKGFELANYVLVQNLSTPYEASVCKLNWCSDLHATYCHVDSSVIHSNKAITAPINLVDLFLNSSAPLRNNYFKILPPLIQIPRVFVTIITQNVGDLQLLKSAKNMNSLIHELRDVLRLYVITNSCVIDLKTLNDTLKLGITYIIIHGFEKQDPSESVLVGRTSIHTDINIVDCISKAKFERNKNVPKKQTLGGLNGPFRSLQDIMISSKLLGECNNKAEHQRSQHVLLIGPSGCGKTTLVREVAACCDSALVEILGPEVCCPLPGDTEKKLREKFDEAVNLASEGLCVLLLDEVDSLCPERNNSGASSHLVRVTSQLLLLLELADTVAGLVVIATTNRPYALDASLRRYGRLGLEIHIGVPNACEREEILEVLLESLNTPTNGNIAAQVAKWTPGYVGADLALVCQHVGIARYRRRKANHESACQLDEWLADFRSAVGNIRPSLLRGGLGVVAGHPTTLAKIGGLKKVKQSLKSAINWPLSHPEAFARMGLPQPRGVLLYGPPGCAKTTIAQAVAAENNTTFLSVSAAELYSPFVGEAEKNISELFHRARLGAPSVIFIDEIDALAGCRGEREQGVQERVLSALLTEMDGIGVRIDDSANSTRLIREGEATIPDSKIHKIPVSNRAVMVIAATNRPDMLDPALIRPGRFDKLVYVPAPNTEDRVEILKAITASMPLDPDVDIPSIAGITEFYSGADLGNLMKEAGLCALTEDGMDVIAIRHIHILHALAMTKPSLTQEKINWYVNYRG